MASLDTFRNETQNWLAENCPESIRGSGLSFSGGDKEPIDNEDFRAWFDRCVSSGYTVPSWPKEYGGAGLTPTEVKVLHEEMRAIRAPQPLVGMGYSMIGPTLLEMGDDEQKARHLKNIAAGVTRWCQGYSEPGAGSDLASLQTKAVSDGDNYVINGSKIWTSGADKADWIFCLVRTDPKASKHEGISFVLFPMDAPGVTVKPIELIAGSSPFCETFFDDVKVPKAERLGSENRGWAIAKRLLQHERFSIGGPSTPSQANKLSSIAMKYVGEIGGKIADSQLRDDILKNEMGARAFKLTTQRSAQENAKGESITFATSMFKYYSTELTCAEDELKLKAMGTQSLGWEGDNFSRKEIATTRSWLFDKALTIAGGSTEVQLNIIAKRVLALPD
ncbi:MAG: alkylation response protein AidB-like acyl-CoA dehydrogenase [Candidatus Azotimanducaceae bacterium]|jgi:alkylation response protein AidB-like acyl-CoA dehydrogenase